MDKLAPYYDKFLKESGTGFFGKSGPSYVDFYIADAFYTLHGVEKDLLDKKYPYLVEHYKRVYALPELQNYLSTRPQTSV
jgi:glutathione S-transferase